MPADPVIRATSPVVRVTLKAAVTTKPGDLLGYNAGWVLADSDGEFPAQLVAMDYGNGDLDGSGANDNVAYNEISACFQGIIEDTDAPYVAGDNQFLSNTAGAHSTTASSQKIGVAVSTSLMAFDVSPSFGRIYDDQIHKLGTDGDSVMVHRSAILAANTALTDVLVGTPVTPALAANSLIVSNVTSAGDFLLALNNGGNSQAWVWVDASVPEMRIYGAGTLAMVIDATDVTFSLNANPTTTDGAALGTGSLMWSDLFLASGAVVNFNNGNVTITHAAAALTSSVPMRSSSATVPMGYAAGAGGTVTQITSITTGVTLNTVTGQITTVAATTAAGAEDSFTVTDSAVAAADTVVCTTTYAGGGLPLVYCSRTAAGSFIVTISNLHASAALDALLVINFTVVKGQTA